MQKQLKKRRFYKMKVKNLFPGMIQILLAVGIFAGAGMMYHLNQEANAQKASRLAEQQKKEAIRLAAQLEQAHALKAICVNLQATLPLIYFLFAPKPIFLPRSVSGQTL